jgi:hypothetical protein
LRAPCRPLPHAWHGQQIDAEGNIYAAIHQAGEGAEQTSVYRWNGTSGALDWGRTITTSLGGLTQPTSLRIDSLAGRVLMGGIVREPGGNTWNGLLQSFTLDGDIPVQFVWHTSEGSSGVVDAIGMGDGSVAALVQKRGQSGWGVDVTKLHIPITLPTTGLRVVRVGPHNAEILWKVDDPNTTGFWVERRTILSETEAAPWDRVTFQIVPDGAPVSVFGYRDSQLFANTTYEWRVIAHGKYGTSAPSNVVRATTPPPTRGTLILPRRHSMKTVDIGGVRRNIVFVTNASRNENLLVNIDLLEAPFQIHFGEGRTLIPPRGRHPVGVGFRPTERGKFGQNLRIRSSDPNRPQAIVPVAGQGGR